MGLYNIVLYNKKIKIRPFVGRSTHVKKFINQTNKV